MILLMTPCRGAQSHNHTQNSKDNLVVDALDLCPSLYNMHGWSQECQHSAQLWC